MAGDIATQGIAVVALIAVATFLGYLIRDYIAHLKGQVDRMFKLADDAVTANEHLADALEQRNRLVR